MSDNITALRGQFSAPLTYQKPDTELIEKLEQMLVDAKSGRLRAMASACVTIDSSTVTGWSGNCDSHQMTAGVSRLYYRFMRAEVDRED